MQRLPLKVLGALGLVLAGAILAGAMLGNAHLPQDAKGGVKLILLGLFSPLIIALFVGGLVGTRKLATYAASRRATTDKKTSDAKPAPGSGTFGKFIWIVVVLFFVVAPIAGLILTRSGVITPGNGTSRGSELTDVAVCTEGE